MVRLVAITGIVASAFAVLTALALAGPALFVAVAVAILAGVVLLMQRSVPGWVGGGLAIVLGIVGALGTTGSLSTRGGGGVDFGMSEGTGAAFLITALMIVPLTAIWWRWGFMPMWAAAVGGVAALAVIVLAFVNAEDVRTLNALTYTIVGLSLVSALPSVMLLVAPADTDPRAAEPAARTSTRKGTAKAK